MSVSDIKKVFSYSLFTPVVLPQHRDWDKWKNNKDRYWFNILSLVLTNKVLFPNHHMVFHLSKCIWENNLSDVFNILKESLTNIEIRTVDIGYNITEPSIWRMMPLWSFDVGYIHTRDLDSFPTLDEMKYVQYFEKNNFLVGTIRSQKNHTGHACRMLAGLSSFNTNIPASIKGHDFQQYYSKRHNRYGCDQDLVADTFTSNTNFTKKYFLDFRTDEQSNDNSFPCNNYSSSEDEIEISKDQWEVLRNIDKYCPSSWLGQPIDSRGEYTKFILSKFKNIEKQVFSKLKIKNFYLEKTR